MASSMLFQSLPGVFFYSKVGSAIENKFIYEMYYLPRIAGFDREEKKVYG